MPYLPAMLSANPQVEALKEACEVDFYTDSEYVKNGIKLWLPNWLKNGWRTSSKEPVKNQDLWERLDAATQRHEIHWHWTKGHAGNEHNERVDKLATAARLRLGMG